MPQLERNPLLDKGKFYIGLNKICIVEKKEKTALKEILIF